MTSRYSVEFTTAAAREVRKLDPTTRRRLLTQIRGLEANPRPAGSRKLAGEAAAWRIHIGDDRVLYEVDDSVETVTVFRVAHRREPYK